LGWVLFFVTGLRLPVSGLQVTGYELRVQDTVSLTVFGVLVRDCVMYFTAKALRRKVSFRVIGLMFRVC
jgi:hypothetical protein